MKTDNRFYHFISGYYNLLLTSLILLFIFRPYTDSLLYLAIWKLFLITVFLSVIFTQKHNKGIKIIATALSAASISLSWINLLYKLDIAFISNTILTSIFIFICTSSIVRNVLIRARVTAETLKGVISAYFMVAFAFAYIYYLIEYLVPGSFHFIQHKTTLFSYTEYLSEMLYFSFGTLLTIGFGDITAITSIGQTAVIIEGIIGQLYVAILVARLVSIYSLRPIQESD